MANSKKTSKLVVDGRSRIVRDNIDRMRKEVKARYADEFENVGWFRRIAIQWRIRAEIKRELDKIAPSSGLYSGCG